ncbi:MAG: radical SAM protein [Candidatus Altiarchaeales archaeon]|nr:radical SAM protein [Candidatus Altiarchaeales archaeon]
MFLVDLGKQLEQWARRKLDKDKIYEIRYTTTWRCNSKCESCYIWNIPPSKEKELTIDELDEFTRCSLLRDVRRIVFSGGEPTMRDDLPEIFSVFHKNCPKAYFGITLNGLMPERTCDMIERIITENPGIELRNVGLSINGPEEIHDVTRGIKGAFRKTMKTYELIKDMVPTRFSFTFLPENFEYFEWTQKFAEEHGTEAYLCWTVFSDRFSSKNLDGFTLNHPKIKEQLNAHCKRKRGGTFRRYDLIVSYLYNHFLNHEPIECYAGRQFFHIDPYGDVYPCNFIEFVEENSFGNIKDTDLCTIWENRDKKILDKIDNRTCQYTEYGLCGDSDLYYSVVANIPEVLRWHIQRFMQGKKKLID